LTTGAEDGVCNTDPLSPLPRGRGEGVVVGAVVIGGTAVDSSGRQGTQSTLVTLVLTLVLGVVSAGVMMVVVVRVVVIVDFALL
jgi:hypothetical protein